MTENEPDGLRARNISHNEYPLQAVSQIGIEVSRVAARKIVAHIGLGEVRQRRESDSGFEMVSEQNRISLSERYSSKIVFFRFVAQNLK